MFHSVVNYYFLKIIFQTSEGEFEISDRTQSIFLLTFALVVWGGEKEWFPNPADPTTPVRVLFVPRRRGHTSRTRQVRRERGG